MDDPSINASILPIDSPIPPQPRLPCFRGLLAAFASSDAQVPMSEVRLHELKLPTGDKHDREVSMECTACCRANPARNEPGNSTNKLNFRGWNPAHQFPKPTTMTPVVPTKGRKGRSKAATVDAPSRPVIASPSHLCMWAQLPLDDLVPSAALADAPTFWMTSTGTDKSHLQTCSGALGSSHLRTPLALGNRSFLAFLASLRKHQRVALVHFRSAGGGSTQTVEQGLFFPVSWSTACLKLLPFTSYPESLARKLQQAWIRHEAKDHTEFYLPKELPVANSTATASNKSLQAQARSVSSLHQDDDPFSFLAETAVTTAAEHHVVVSSAKSAKGKSKRGSTKSSLSAPAASTTSTPFSDMVPSGPNQFASAGEDTLLTVPKEAGVVACLSGWNDDSEEVQAKYPALMCHPPVPEVGKNVDQPMQEQILAPTAASSAQTDPSSTIVTDAPMELDEPSLVPGTDAAPIVSPPTLKEILEGMRGDLAQMISSSATSVGVATSSSTSTSQAHSNHHHLQKGPEHAMVLIHTWLIKITTAWPKNEEDRTTDETVLLEMDRTPDDFLVRALRSLRIPASNRGLPTQKEERVRFLAFQMQIRLRFFIPAAAAAVLSIAPEMNDASDSSIPSIAVDTVLSLVKECSLLLNSLPIHIDRVEFIQQVLWQEDYAPPAPAPPANGYGHDAVLDADSFEWSFEPTVRFLAERLEHFDCPSKQNEPKRMIQLWDARRQGMIPASLVDRSTTHTSLSKQQQQQDGQLYDAVPSPILDPSAAMDVSGGLAGASALVANSSSAAPDKSIEAWLASRSSLTVPMQMPAVVRASRRGLNVVQRKDSSAAVALALGVDSATHAANGNSSSGFSFGPSVTDSSSFHPGLLSTMFSTTNSIHHHLPVPLQSKNNGVCASMSRGHLSKRFQVTTLVKLKGSTKPKVAPPAVASANTKPTGKAATTKKKSGLTPTRKSPRKAATTKAGGVTTPRSASKKHAAKSPARLMGSAKKSPAAKYKAPFNSPPPSHTKSRSSPAGVGATNAFLSPRRTPLRSCLRSIVVAMTPSGSSHHTPEFTIQETPAKGTPSPQAAHLRRRSTRVSGGVVPSAAVESSSKKKRGASIGAFGSGRGAHLSIPSSGGSSSSSIIPANAPAPAAGDLALRRAKRTHAEMAMDDASGGSILPSPTKKQKLLPCRALFKSPAKGSGSNSTAARVAPLLPRYAGTLVAPGSGSSGISIVIHATPTSSAAAEGSPSASSVVAAMNASASPSASQPTALGSGANKPPLAPASRALVGAPAGSPSKVIAAELAQAKAHMKVHSRHPPAKRGLDFSHAAIAGSQPLQSRRSTIPTAAPATGESSHAEQSAPKRARRDSSRCSILPPPAGTSRELSRTLSIVPEATHSQSESQDMDDVVSTTSDSPPLPSEMRDHVPNPEEMNEEASSHNDAMEIDQTTSPIKQQPDQEITTPNSAPSSATHSGKLRHNRTYGSGRSGKSLQGNDSTSSKKKSKSRQSPVDRTIISVEPSKLLTMVGSPPLLQHHSNSLPASKRISTRTKTSKV